MLYNSRLLTLLILFTIIGCNTMPDEVVHPVPERLPAAEEIDYTLDLEDVGVESISGILNYDSLEVTSVIESDTSNLEFFEIQEVELDPEGNIYISTPQSNAIYVYDRQGGFQYRIGREGRGPGEFNRLIAFDFNSSYDRLYALDQNEIEIYSLEDGRFEPENTLLHGLMMQQDLCLLNGGLYVSGLKFEELDSPADEDKPFSIMQFTSGPIHRFDAQTGEITAELGPLYRSFSGFIFADAVLSSLKLACNEATNTVVGMFMHTPYFFGYEPDGTEKWISNIEDVQYSIVTERGINTSRPSYSVSVEYGIQPFRKTGSEFALIQTRYGEPDPFTFLLDTGTGELHFGGTSSVWRGPKWGNTLITMPVDGTSQDSVRIIQINNVSEN